MEKQKSPAFPESSKLVFLEDWIALHQLNSDHWARVDRVSDQPVHELYVEDGELLIGTLEKRGHASLRDYFSARRVAEAAIGRRTRHIVSGFSVEFDGADVATIRSTVVVFAGAGELPLVSGPPSTIGDFVDHCVRNAEGRWLYARRQAGTIFIGAGAAPFAR